MLEIILSFFASIGIVLIAARFMDYLFYRNTKVPLTLLVDLRQKTEEEAIEILELISTVRQSYVGRAVIGEILVFIDEKELSRRAVEFYMKAFSLNGIIFSSEEEEGEIIESGFSKQSTFFR